MDHDRCLLNVLKRLEENDFRLQPSKCKFSQSEIPAFSHIISKDGIRPDTKNIQRIIHFPIPTNVKEVQSFLGLINFFGDYISGLGTLSEPLRKLTRQGNAFLWDDSCSKSFHVLKLKVANALPLHIFDPTHPTILTTDASDSAVID